MLGPRKLDETHFGFRTFAAIHLFVAAAILGGSFWTGVQWFALGDFEWREAMTVHAVLIPAWMLLALASLEQLGPAGGVKWNSLVGWTSVVSSLLAGAGALTIRTEGISAGSVIQGLGMALADLAGIAVLATLVLPVSRESHRGCYGLALWTLIASLAAVSAATPLGHLAAGVKALGNQFFVFHTHASMMGLEPKKVLEGYVGSHGHQIVAAFLAAAFVLPLVRKRITRPGLDWAQTCGLSLVLLATVAQVAVYQASAWLGWEPPTLFVRGPSGVPLDDIVLALLGGGFLLLIPALTAPAGGAGNGRTGSRPAYGAFVPLLMAFAIAIVGLGLYIEFHEEFFGHGEETGAPGRLKDLAYIRSHLLFGCMIIPLLLGSLSHVPLSLGKTMRLAIHAIGGAAVLSGSAGVFWWTFALEPFLMKLAMCFAALSAVVLAIVLALDGLRAPGQLDSQGGPKAAGT